jgi:hypothetical protein
MTGSTGQDWASYQDDAPSTKGLAFAFVKQTEGTGYVNPKAAAQVAHARGDGLVVGHYHYPHMAASPGAECDFFLQHAKPQPGDVLILDWEGYDAANKGVPWSRQVAYKEQFLARLDAVAPLHQHLVYCSADYLAKDPKGQYGDGLWIATAGHPAGQPGISHTWLFHQYSTAGGIDHDYTPMTPAQLKAWSHAKETDDMALTDADKKAIADATAAAVMAYRLDDPTRSGTQYMAFKDVFWWVGAHSGQAATQITALSAAVTALTAQLGKDVDTATVVAAVQKAIADAVVKVDVNVTGPTA